MSDTKTTVTEMVLYTIKAESRKGHPEEGFQKLRKTVSGLKGFESFKTFRANKNENYFMDLVEWSSLENAQNAAKEIQARMEKGDFQKLMSTLEKIEFFDHFNFVS